MAKCIHKLMRRLPRDEVSVTKRVFETLNPDRTLTEGTHLRQQDFEEGEWIEVLVITVHYQWLGKKIHVGWLG